MNFPITFSSPSEGVKAIYEMKQSNPGATIIVQIESQEIIFEDEIIMCEYDEIDDAYCLIFKIEDCITQTDEAINTMTGIDS